MFIKFIRHDLRHGILQRKGHMVLSFLLFFCLSSYRFLLVRIYELLYPQYFDSPVTTADYFISIIGGCGRTESGPDSSFTMPIIWCLFILWVMFSSLYYPFTDLYGIGKHLMILSENRGTWWISKCIWTVMNTLSVYLIIFAACFLSGLCFGATPSMEANWYLYNELQITDYSELVTKTTWNIWPVFFLTALVLVTLSLLQLFLSLASRPLFSFLFLAAYLFAGILIQHPAFLGNYAMAARSSYFVISGLQPNLGILICFWVLTISAGAGYLLFQRKDILGEG